MRDVASVRVTDFRSFLHAGIRRFRNPEHCARQIIERHSLTKEQFQNAKKQGRQLASCVSLALSYYNSALTAEGSIKPVLIYYSLMNFALAEILVKQNGNSSLDRLRENNRSHGLQFSYDGSKHDDGEVTTIGNKLVGRPQIQSEGWTGTFSVWHRTARELPVIGKITHADNSISYRQVLAPTDEELPKMPTKGLSFIDAVRLMPTMNTHLAARGIESAYCRGSAAIKVNGSGTSSFTLLVHPDRKEKLERLMDQMLFSQSCIDTVSVREYDSGFALTVADFNRKDVSFRFPAVTFTSKDELYLFSENSCLNEFGAFYLAFFLLGNLCRYYPEQWMKEVESNTDFSAFCDIVCNEFFERVPQLVLAELGRVMYTYD